MQVLGAFLCSIEILLKFDDVEGAEPTSAPARDWDDTLAQSLDDEVDDAPEEHDVIEQPPVPMPFTQVVSHLQALTDYAASTGNAAFMEHVMALKDLTSTIASEQPKKQCKISDFDFFFPKALLWVVVFVASF